MRCAFAVAVVMCAVTAGAQDVHVHVVPGVKPNATNFPTIQMALDHAADAPAGARLVLHIAPGVYKERVWVSRRRARTTFLGEGSDAAQVVITADEAGPKIGGTFFSETTEINGDAFEADNVTFANGAGATGQALAISVSSDQAVFKRCRFLGYQDTLFADYGRQYYVDSYVEGAVDFIFGNAAAVFDRDEIHVTRAGYVTAQSRTEPGQTTGYVITHSRITADATFYLGRPWRAYSRVVVMHSELPAALNAKGWQEWAQNAAELNKVFYAEFGNTGEGARTAERVPWAHALSAKEAANYEPKVFLRGADAWDPVAEAAKLP